MLIRHTLYFLPTQLLAPLAQLASMVLWTHWLQPEAMGVFTLVSVMQEMAYLLCLGWFSSYALRYLPGPDQDEAMRRYLATENVVVTVSVLLGALVAIPATWSLQTSSSPTEMALAVAAFFITRGLNAHYAERARAQSAFLTYGVLQLAGPVGGLALGWLVLQQVAPSAQALLWAYAAAQGLGCLLALPGLGMYWRFKALDRPMLKDAISFGAPVLALSALGWVAENHVRYLVQWRDGAQAMGLMIVGWSLGRRAASVAAMLVTAAAFPLASRMLNDGRQQEALRQLQTNAALMMGVLLPATVGMFLIGPALAKLVVAPPYQTVTAQVIGLSMLSGALRNLHVHATDQLMLLQRRMGMMAGVSVIEIVACAGATLVGMVLDPWQGAVVGQTVGSAIALVVSMWWVHRHLAFRWPWLDTLRIALACSGMAVVMLMLAPQQGGLLPLLVWGASGALAYAACAALLYQQVLRSRWAARRVS
jgi:O-antigen/teichoic acid export membrane protein